MTEPATAATPAAAPAPGSQSTIMELLTADTPAAASQPASAARPEPKGFIDPLDEADFTDAKLGTPEGVRAARAVIQAQVKEALRLRTAANNRVAEATRREEKLGKTKQSTLSEKQATVAQTQMLQRELQDLQSGDPEKFIQVIGRLANAKDPYDFWNKTAIALAKGKPVEADVEGPIPKAVQERLDRIEAERAAEKEQQAKHIEQSTERQLFDLRVQQVKDATTFTDLRHVSALASDIEHVPLIDARLVAIKEEHFAKHNTPLDTRAACGILEAEIQSHFELLQRAGNPNGAMNGEREAAASVAGLARQPERQIAKPEPAPSAPAQNRSASAIPASLSAVAATTTRARTKAEKDAATIAGLEALGVFQNFGMR